MEQNDALDDCIIQMFGEEEELENTDISIPDDYTNIPDQEVTDDDNSNATKGRTDEDNNNVTGGRSTSTSVPKISLGNVFVLGRQKMIKISLVREKRKARINRSHFFHTICLFIKLTNNELHALATIGSQ